MALNAFKLLQGPARIYVGAFGATEPAITVPLAAPSTGWTEVGLTQGGTTLNISQEYAALEADQILDRAGSAPTSREISVVTNMAEVTLDNLVIALNGGTVTPTASSATVWEPEYDEEAFVPEYRAVILRGYGPRGEDGLRKRRHVIVRKVLSTEGVEVAFSKTDQTVLAVTFLGHFVDDTTAPIAILDEPETEG